MTVVLLQHLDASVQRQARGVRVRSSTAKRSPNDVDLLLSNFIYGKNN